MQPPRAISIERHGAHGVGVDLHLLDRWVRVASADEAFVVEFARSFAPPPHADPSLGAAHLCVRVERARAAAPRAVHSVPEGELVAAWPWAIATPADLVSAVTQWVVRHTAVDGALHAAAVARAGRALLLPAASGSGKSTLAAALLQRGWDLLSDEVVAVSSGERRVIGYPRQLHLRDDVLDVLGLAGRKRDAVHVVSAEELGGRRIAAADLGVVVGPRWVRGAATRLDRLTPGRAVALLTRSSVARARGGADSFLSIVDLARAVPCFGLVFSDLGGAVTALERAFAESRAAGAAG